MSVANALLVVSDPAVIRTRASSASLCVSISSFGSLSSASVKRLIRVGLFAESTFVSLWAILISRHVSKHLCTVNQHWHFNREMELYIFEFEKDFHVWTGPS